MSIKPKKGELIVPLATSVDKFGRPSKLTPQVIAQAWDWLNSCAGVSMQSLVPTIEGLALELRISRDTVYEWEKQNTDFSDIVKHMRSAQAEKLIQNALVGRYNPTIAKLLLSKHGYVERQEIDQNLNVVTPILSGMAKQADKKVIDVHSDPDNL